MKQKTSLFLTNVFTAVVKLNLPDVEPSFGDFVNSISFLDEQKQQPNRVFILTNEWYKLCLKIPVIKHGQSIALRIIWFNFIGLKLY